MKIIRLILIQILFFIFMKKSNKKKIEEFIRVDHAGERGAIKIYEGQLLALNTLVKDDEMKKTIEEMREHEREHANYFENEIKKRGIMAFIIMLVMTILIWSLVLLG